MWLESINRVYGYTRNPYDARCLVGGSSGGEAAAAAAVYAPFGLGSDIGGSIRLPSMFCGTFGHKPSTRLVPNRGQVPGVRHRGHNIFWCQLPSAGTRRTCGR
jgi:fatty acid amide hydrolase 2